MVDQKKLLMRIKNVVDRAGLTINSQVYFISDCAIYMISNLTTRKSELKVTWEEGEMMKSKVIYEPPGVVTIVRVVPKKDKDMILLVLSDNAIVAISEANPARGALQVIKQENKE